MCLHVCLSLSCSLSYLLTQLSVCLSLSYLPSFLSLYLLTHLSVCLPSCLSVCRLPADLFIQSLLIITLYLAISLTFFSLHFRINITTSCNISSHLKAFCSRMCLVIWRPTARSSKLKITQSHRQHSIRFVESSFPFLRFNGRIENKS